MKAVKISLELAIVPIRKFLIIFFIYMRMLFGDKPRDPVGMETEQMVEEIEAKMPFREKSRHKKLLYLKESAERFLSPEVKPRFKLKTDHPVELFYKRHMSSD
jgi:hypothetical protein